ncbi:asparaginase domain-containing protein [Nocardioides massiliensis]|uniref:L-asparaginase/Glu-tRNA(Gln) amidotransferase subunit D n=1 Tax=Nocardioides massiliensis TaxID=1325935 RepID=A0ABT9NNQ6_9ACTN|nr:asparaginase domain-containing protein [Nocardioides massiliensis]MDP9821834.1 L-asparaginase/Glu-tRNA(Gln) amidotransferase subunit D [Nocardioides massiliensis]
MTDRSVHWFALGGTIQAQGHDALDRHRYFRTGQTVDATALLAQWPAAGPAVVVEQIAAGASHNLSPALVLDLARRLRDLDPRTVSGAVVSLGSNALEEVAFLLWLFGPAPVPVVVTAAMRPPTALGTDAHANLFASLTLAGSAEGLRAGTVVVSDDAVLHPVGLTKSHTADVDAFSASGVRLGTVEPGRRPKIHRSGSASPLVGSELPADLAPVFQLASHLGSDGTLVQAAVQAGARGIVAVGLGAGFPPAAELDALRAAHEAGVAICLARRTARGRTTGAAETAPLLSAGELTALQARLVLSVALSGESASTAVLQTLLDDCHA